jgi:hypothetical protein
VEDVSSPKATGTLVEAIAPGKTYGLIAGKSSSAKSGYVRVANSAQSLLAAPLLVVDAEPRRWIDRTLIDIPMERIKEIVVKTAGGPTYTAFRATKEQTDFTVADLPKGRALSSPAAADPIAGGLAGLAPDDVQRAATTGSAELSHATFHTFDGLQVEVFGRKDGSRSLISLAPSASAQSAQAEAQALTARVQGWEYEIPSYKYDVIFRPLEDLLQRPPEKPKKAASPKASAGRNTEPAAPAGKKTQAPPPAGQ